MVLQLLARGAVALGEVGMVGQQIEAVAAVAEMRADYLKLRDRILARLS